MRIELYQQKHFKSCIKIIQSSTSKYISPSEQFDYINFLLRISKRYFVFFKANDLLACGGYGFNKTKRKSVLTRGLVDREHYNKGNETY